MRVLALISYFHSVVRVLNGRNNSPQSGGVLIGHRPPLDWDRVPRDEMDHIAQGTPTFSCQRQAAQNRQMRHHHERADHPGRVGRTSNRAMR